MEKFIQNNQLKKVGAAEQTTAPIDYKTNANFNDNSSFNQRLKLLDYLLEHGSITTQKARALLDIYYPPARIKELRQAGYLIVTVWEVWISEYGIKHRIARYVLTHKQPVETLALNEVAA
jgi:hypothetical protein